MSDKQKNFRELESGIHTDLKDRLTYGEYLSLDTILNAQNRLSTQHDEMLFIIIHQASELWLKLAGHEVEAAIGNVKDDDYRHAFKVIARVKLIFNQLVNSWNILSTMTPVDYLTFREMLGPASGFQSYAYRKLEFLLGNKNAGLVEVHRHDDKVYDDLSAVLTAPSLYDVVIAKLPMPVLTSMLKNLNGISVSLTRLTSPCKTRGSKFIATPTTTSSCMSWVRNLSTLKMRFKAGASNTCSQCSGLLVIAKVPVVHRVCRS